MNAEHNWLTGLLSVLSIREKSVRVAGIGSTSRENARYKSRIPSISIVVLASMLTACTEVIPEKPIRPVLAMKLGDASEFTARTFPGRAKAASEVNLSFRVAGPMITRAVDVGTKVEEGDLIARIDPRDFEVELQNRQGHLGRAEANLVRAEKDYERVVRTRERDPGAISEAAVDRARDQRDSAKAEVKALKASVASAKDRLDYTYLTAPYDGVVVATYAENFEFVQAQQPIIRMLDDTQIEMVINIPERMFSLIPYVKEHTVVFDAHPDVSLPARVKEVGREATETTRTYPVTLSIQQPEAFNVVPGMAGRASGRLELPNITERRVSVPVAAVAEDADGKRYVWVLKLGEETSGGERLATSHRREVTIGALSDSGLTITSGVEIGEYVATAGVYELREGLQVRVGTASGEGAI